MTATARSHHPTPSSTTSTSARRADSSTLPEPLGSRYRTTAISAFGLTTFARGSSSRAPDLACSAPNARVAMDAIPLPLAGGALAYVGQVQDLRLRPERVRLQRAPPRRRYARRPTYARNLV